MSDVIERRVINIPDLIEAAPIGAVCDGSKPWHILRVVFEAGYVTTLTSRDVGN
jgi:hypothetical protein